MALDLPPISLEDAQHIYEQPAHVRKVESSTEENNALKASKNEVAKARLQAVFDAAFGVGVKAGMSWQLTNIKKALHRRKREFDTVYDFSLLMIASRVVPPVITEARDLYNQDGDYALRLSGAYYKIESQARFSSVAPNWRDYLNFPNTTLTRSALMISLAALLPRDRDERRVWRLAVYDGWKQGVEQANLILRHALDRMNRDFLGMIRFHKFVAQHKITMPIVANEFLSVNRNENGQEMAVDETLLRITTLPEFDAKIDRWTSAIVSSSSSSPTVRVLVPKKRKKRIGKSSFRQKDGLNLHRTARNQ